MTTAYLYTHISPFVHVCSFYNHNKLATILQSYDLEFIMYAWVTTTLDEYVETKILQMN